MISIMWALMRCYLLCQRGRAQEQEESFDEVIVRMEATAAFMISMRDDPEYRARVEAARDAKAMAEARLILAAQAGAQASARVQGAMEALQSASSSEPTAPPESRGNGSRSACSTAPPADGVVEAARARLRAEVRASTEVLAEFRRAQQALVAAQVSMKDVYRAGLNPRRTRATRRAGASSGGREGDEEMQPMMEIREADSLEAGRLAQ